MLLGNNTISSRKIRPVFALVIAWYEASRGMNTSHILLRSQSNDGDLWFLHNSTTQLTCVEAEAMVLLNWLCTRAEEIVCLDEARGFEQTESAMASWCGYKVVRGLRFVKSWKIFSLVRFKNLNFTRNRTEAGPFHTEFPSCSAQRPQFAEDAALCCQRRIPYFSRTFLQSMLVFEPQAALSVRRNWFQSTHLPRDSEDSVGSNAWAQEKWVLKFGGPNGSFSVACSIRNTQQTLPMSLRFHGNAHKRSNTKHLTNVAPCHPTWPEICGQIIKSLIANDSRWIFLLLYNTMRHAVLFPVENIGGSRAPQGLQRIFSSSCSFQQSNQFCRWQGKGYFGVGLVAVFRLSPHCSILPAGGGPFMHLLLSIWTT